MHGLARLGFAKLPEPRPGLTNMTEILKSTTRHLDSVTIKREKLSKSYEEKEIDLDLTEYQLLLDKYDQLSTKLNLIKAKYE